MSLTTCHYSKNTFTLLPYGSVHRQCPSSHLYQPSPSNPLHGASASSRYPRPHTMLSEFLFSDGTPVLQKDIIGRGSAGVVVLRDGIAINIPYQSQRCISRHHFEQQVHQRIGHIDGVVRCLGMSKQTIELTYIKNGDLGDVSPIQSSFYGSEALLAQAAGQGAGANPRPVCADQRHSCRQCPG